MQLPGCHEYLLVVLFRQKIGNGGGNVSNKRVAVGTADGDVVVVGVVVVVVVVDDSKWDM